jgi:hypothetical protein
MNFCPVELTTATVVDFAIGKGRSVKPGVFW